MKLIHLNEIDLESSPIVRFCLDDDTIAEYAETYQSKKPMPPLDVFQLEGQKYFLLADGRHRHAALRKLGTKTAVVNIHKGTRHDCIKFATHANLRHGLRRTSADKRVSAELVIREFPGLANRALAEIAGVDDHTIASLLRKSASAEIPRINKTDLGKTQVKSKAGRLMSFRPQAPPDEPPQKVAPHIERDEDGLPIPKGVLEFWDRRQEIQDTITEVSKLKCRLADIGEAQDKLYFGVNFQTVEAALSQVYTTVSNAKPYVVCTQCQGHPETQPNKLCRLCGGKGFISKYQWDQLVPKEIQALREKQIEQSKVKK